MSTKKPEQPKPYKSPRAFKNDFSRRYRAEPDRALVLLMQRFVARVCHAIENTVVKGGLGLEIRLNTPRTTKDADLIISGSHDLDARLKSAGMLDMGDFLRFAVRPEKNDQFVVPGMDYHAKRYIVQVYFADHIPPTKSPDRKFTLEVSIRDSATFDMLPDKWSDFDQIKPTMIPVYSIEWQIAEKVHAYTDPRHRETTNPNRMRPRDLLDLCRCAIAPTSLMSIESRVLRDALVQTFAKRKRTDTTLQDLPPWFPKMPSSWQSAFDKQVGESSLPWKTSASAHAVAARFLDPVLANTATGTWDPDSGWIS